MIWDWLFPKEITKTISPVNGELRVVRVRGETAVWSRDFEQSGPLVGKIWRKAISQTRLPSSPQVLVLGLGAGTVIPIIRRIYPQAQITGMDNDQVILDLGRKYFAWPSDGISVVAADIFAAIDKPPLSRKKFDLILVDIYRDGDFPRSAGSAQFTEQLARLLSPQGIVIYNRLRPKTTKSELDNFLDILRHFFTIREEQVDYNLLIFASGKKSASPAK